MPPKKETKPSTEVEAEKPKGIQPPNKEQYNTDIKAKNAEIEKLQREQNKIQHQLQEKSSGKDEFYEEKSRLLAKLHTYKDQIDKLTTNRKEFQKQLENFKKFVDNRKKLTYSVRLAEQSISFSNESEVDARIQQIEFEMCTGTLSLKDEKKKVAEIQLLKKHKPKIGAAAEASQKLQDKQKEMSESSTYESIKDQIDANYAKTNAVWEQKKAVKKDLDALIETRRLNTETSELDKAKNDLRDQIKTLVTERNDLRKKLADEETAYRNHQQEQYRLAQAKRQAESQQRRNELEKSQMQRQEEKLFKQPHVAEVSLLEQTIQFCNNLLPKTKQEERENVQPEFNNPEGYAILVQKKDRDEEMYMTASKKKGPHKKNKAASSNVIKHDAYTFRLFDALKVTAPSTLDQIPGTLEKLTAELDKYKEKIAIWEAKKNDGSLLKEFQEKNAEKQEKKKAVAAETQDDTEEKSPVAAVEE